MYFGITNDPATFMDLIIRVFRNYLNVFVIIFIDEIMVDLKNESDHWVI